MATDHIKN